MTKQVQPGRSNAQLTVFSPAKINLYLKILGKRPDGYHELETVMLPLQFGDEITLQSLETGCVLECDHPGLPSDDSNIALRAAKLLAERFGEKWGAKITLHKRTPLAAGLGGGSSNAAAVLMGLNRLWNLNASNETLHELAARLGSDVNFFLASGAALCRGRGERIEPIAGRFAGTILLANPGFGISTKWAYENWAKAAAESRLTGKSPEVSLLVRALAEDDLAGVAQGLFNSLEIPSVRKFPVLGLIKEAMCEGGAAGALMSGSGATLFGLFANESDAKRCARQIREQFGPSMWAAITRSADTSSEPDAQRDTAR